MSVHVRPATLQDGVAVLELLEQVGYYPEPISFAKTYRKTLTDPHFLVRVAEAEDGKIVGMASLSLRWQLGLGGPARLPGRAGRRAAASRPPSACCLQATVGKARSLGARRVAMKANEGTPPPRAAQIRAAAAAGGSRGPRRGVGRTPRRPQSTAAPRSAASCEGGLRGGVHSDHAGSEFPPDLIRPA
jgi:hypothetical protein